MKTLKIRPQAFYETFSSETIREDQRDRFLQIFKQNGIFLPHQRSCEWTISLEKMNTLAPLIKNLGCIELSNFFARAAKKMCPNPTKISHFNTWDGKDTGLFCLHVGADQETQFAVAMKIARGGDGHLLAEEIRRFDFSLEQRFEIAKVVAAEENWAASQGHIDKFDLEEPQRFEIAKIYTQSKHSGMPTWAFLQHPEKFALTKEHLLELAQIFASQGDARAIREHRELFQLDDSEFFDLIKILAGNSDCSPYLQSHSFTHEQLFELAKISAKSFGPLYKTTIKTYTTFSEEELAALSEYEKFGRLERFTDLKNKILKARSSPIHEKSLETLCSQIKTYHLEEEERFQIAKLIASLNGSCISKEENIAAFEITNSQHLREILTIALVQDPDTMLKNYLYANDSLQHPADYFLMAKALVWSRPSYLICTESHFDIEEKSHLQQLLMIALGKALPSTTTRLRDVLLSRSDCSLSKEISQNWPDISKDQGEELLSFLAEHFPDGDWKSFIFDPVLAAKDSGDFIKRLSWAGFMTSLLHFEDFLPSNPLEESTKEDFLPLWGKFSSQCWKYLTVEMQAITSEAFFRSIWANLELYKFFAEKIEQKRAHLVLPLLMQFYDHSDNKAEAQKLIENILTSQHLKTRWLHNSTNLKLLLDTIRILSQDSTHSVEFYLQLLARLLTTIRTPKALRENLYAIKGISQFKESSRLTHCLDLETSPSSLLIDVVKEKIPLSTIPENFITDYTKTFGACRRSGALFTYAAAHNDNVLMMQSITYFLEKTIEGTFPSCRYDLHASLHLRKIAELLDEGKWEMWKNLRTEVPLKELSLERSSSDKVDVIKFFQTKFEDTHLSQERLPNLLSFIKRSGGASQQTEFTTFEEACIALCDSDLPCDAKIRIIKSLEVPEEFREFKESDLPALLQNLEASKRKLDSLSGYSAVITDDWQDLFLCGTEVSGSCQRIDELGEFNKGLMGYVLDGKHLLLAIKSPSGQIIARRILRMLIDTKTNKPALFKERFYGTSDSRFVKALDQLAEKAAVELGISLFECEKHPSLASLSGTVHAPFEYVDANAIQICEGKYVIAPRA